MINDNLEYLDEKKFETILFLPDKEERKGEGGLRTKGYFKKSYDDKPLISIITVVFNGEKYLEQTIQSVINQSYDNVEYIIVDGGSTDGTVDIIKKYEEQIDYWVSEEDEGIYDAMNKGIKVFKGDYINFLNAGDSFVNKDVLNDIFNNNDNYADVIYGAISLRDYNMKFITYVNPKKFTKFNLMFWGTGTLCHQAMFVNKNIVVDYSLNYKLKGELNWYFDLCKNIKKIRIVNFPIVNYILGGTGDTNYSRNIKEAISVQFNQNKLQGIISLPMLFYHFFRKKLEK